jgi:hypothetical protein
MSIFPYQSAASVLGGLGPHRRQHEFGGGDEVFIDPELIKIGLFTPDSPPTFGGFVQPFYYSHPETGLQLFAGSRIDGMDAYKPSGASDVRFVSISLNPYNGQLAYRAGNELSAAIPGGSYTFEELLAAGGSVLIPGGEAAFPPVPGGEIPVATFLLTNSTANINWSSSASSPYYHSRLFLGKVDTDIYARLTVLERNANISTLPTTLAGRWGAFGDKNVHDGDFRIGRINDQQTSGSSPSWGNKLFFSGALGTASWNSENSDSQWLARYNADNDVSFLRMSIGDNSSGDAFQIGYTSAGTYNSLFSFRADAQLGIGTSAPTGPLDVNGDFIRIRNEKTPGYISAPGDPGQICWDYDNLYVCVSASLWKRAILGLW